MDDKGNNDYRHLVCAVRLTDHAFYADWFKKKGDLPSAKEQLTRSIEIFRECGADGWVEKYEKKLAEL